MSIIGIKEVKENLIGNIHLLKKVKGYSAYDLAVNEGFKGTLQEWLKSLKGEKGDTGTLESHTEVDALGHRVVNVADPTENGDAINLKFANRRFVKCYGLAPYAQETSPGNFKIGSFADPLIIVFACAVQEGYICTPYCSNYNGLPDEWYLRVINAETGEPASTDSGFMPVFYLYTCNYE